MPPPKRPFVAQDFRVPVDFRETREARRLERKLGADGLLGWLTLQGRVAVEAPDGRLTGWDASDVGEAARCECPESEFLEALLSIGLLHLDGETLVVSDWAEAQPFIAESGSRRASAAKAARSRWDAARMRPASEAHTTRNAEAMPTAYDPQCGTDAPTMTNQPHHTKPTNQTSTLAGAPRVDAHTPAHEGADPWLDALVGDEPKASGVQSLAIQQPVKALDASPMGQRKLRGAAKVPEALRVIWGSLPGKARVEPDKAAAEWVNALTNPHPLAPKVSEAELVRHAQAWAASEHVAAGYVVPLWRWLRDSRWQEDWTAKRPRSQAEQQLGAVRGTALDRVAAAQAREDARMQAEEAVVVEAEEVH